MTKWILFSIDILFLKEKSVNTKLTTISYGHFHEISRPVQIIIYNVLQIIII